MAAKAKLYIADNGEGVFTALYLTTGVVARAPVRTAAVLIEMPLKLRKEGMVFHLNQ